MIVDLTRTLEDGQPGVSITRKFARPDDGWNATTLELYSHTGTHLDAPAHFFAERRTVEGIPLGNCMGPAHLVKLDGIAPKTLIEVEDLGEVAERFVAGESLILQTGWSAHFDNRDYYRGEFPRVSEKLAQWCVERGVKMLGVEPPSVADVLNLPEVTLIHEILLGARIVIVEGLMNLERLSSGRVFFAAVPLKVGSGDGSPCRAFAVEGELSTLMEP